MNILRDDDDDDDDAGFLILINTVFVHLSAHLAGVFFGFIVGDVLCGLVLSSTTSRS